MLCQGDAMKKDMSLKLVVMTTVLLVVAVVVASIIAQRKCKFRNHDKKNMIREGLGSKVTVWTWPRGGHRGMALLEHFHKHIAGVVLQLWSGPLARGAARRRRAQLTAQRTSWR
jgi:hypothetical protein